MWTKCKSLILSTILVKIVFGILVIMVFSIPFLVKWYDSISVREEVFVPLTIILYLAMVPAFVIVFVLNRLLSNIRKEQVFIDQNVTILRIISWCCFTVSILFFIFGFWRELSFLIAFAAAFFGLILRVLKNVFEQAVAMRIENDFTI